MKKPAAVMEYEMETARFLATIGRRQDRRFLARPVPPTGFGALPEPPDYDLELAKALEAEEAASLEAEELEHRSELARENAEEFSPAPGYGPWGTC